MYIKVTNMTIQLRLWTRMIASALHESTDAPPDVPRRAKTEVRVVNWSLTGAV